jgi:hypothetical protein
MDRRPIRCALLTNLRSDWAAALTLACEGLEFVTLSPLALGIADAPNPFGLPVDDHADAVLLTSYWHNWLTTRHPSRVDEVTRVLQQSADAVVGVDGTDCFELAFRARSLAQLTTVIKFQGVFRDRDLYNYDVGPWWPDAIWSQKARPKPSRYRDEDLEKIRLSVPCLMMDLPGLLRVARRYEAGAARTIGSDMSRSQQRARNVGEEVLSAALAAAPIGMRPLDVHCVATLTHVQRLEAIHHLEGFSGSRGIDRIPPTVAGTQERAGACSRNDSSRALLDEATPFLRERVGRVRYIQDMCRHRVVVAPTGYGELGPRHAWALRTGAALVCQDLSHVEMMFPLRDRENVVFCRHDLADLRPVVRELLDDDSARRRIAREGRRSFAAWSKQWRSHLDVGIAAHIRAALNAAPSPTPYEPDVIR